MATDMGSPWGDLHGDWWVDGARSGSDESGVWRALARITQFLMSKRVQYLCNMKIIFVITGVCHIKCIISYQTNIISNNITKYMYFTNYLVQHRTHVHKAYALCSQSLT
jgi:hypothetical protein